MSNLVFSVPHTGTRTLAKKLGDLIGYHFGQDDKFIQNYKGHFHFPIRDPLATSLSWRRYADAAPHSNARSFDEFMRWDLAIDKLSKQDHTVHVIENIDLVIGHSGDHWTREFYDRKELPDLPEIPMLLDWFPKHRKFFLKYYPEGFWWDDGKD